MTENSVKHSHEYYVGLAQRLPKIPEDELTPQERTNGHAQFGNNFYCLFIGRLEANRSPNPEEYRSGKTNHISSLKLNIAEKYFEKEWSRFQDNNEDLLKQIDETLDELSGYKQILRHYNDLLLDAHKTNEYATADTFYSTG